MKALNFTAVAAVALAGLIVVSGPAAAHGSRVGGLFGSSFKIAKLSRHLDLSESQRVGLRAILDEARPDADRLADEMMANRRAMKSLHEFGAQSDEAMVAIARERGDLVANMTVLHARVHSRIRALLSPEQLERLKNMRKQRRENRHGHRKHGHPESFEEGAGGS